MIKRKSFIKNKVPGRNYEQKSDENEDFFEKITDEEKSDSYTEEEENREETATEKRRRLAQDYLDEIKKSEEIDCEYGFDSKELENDLISKRLKKDNLKEKGSIHIYIGNKIEEGLKQEIKKEVVKVKSNAPTDFVIHFPYLFTVSKEGEIVKWNISKEKIERIISVKKNIKDTQNNNEYTNKRVKKKSNIITSIVVTVDGKQIVTGGENGKLVFWSTQNLDIIRILEVRSQILSMTMRKNTDELYVACSNLVIKIYSTDNYCLLKTLYGHQDTISSISSLNRKTCVSVGSRDKTAMFWKIDDESRLIFRGGDYSNEKTNDHYVGSLDVVSMNDETHFTTGSDSGCISFWSISRKKPLFSEKLAHGLQSQKDPSQSSAEISLEIAAKQVQPPNPYWITAIHSVPFSDFFVSGSYNGSVKLWKINPDFRSFVLLGELTQINGCVVAIDSMFLDNEKKIAIYILVSNEHKFGRWLSKLHGSKNALFRFFFNI